MAQADYYLKLDGIEGESSDDKHKGTIEILSFSLGARQSGTGGAGGGHGAGKVQVHDMVITKKTDKASPKLFLACASGQHIKKAELFCRKAGGKQDDYLVIKLEEVMVSSYNKTGSSHSPTNVIPTEQISLNFVKIEMEYKEQKPDGSMGGAVKAGWHIGQHKKV